MKKKTELPNFPAFVDEYYDATFSWSPSPGTASGFHQYDGQIEDRSAAAYAKRIATLESQKLKAAAFPPEALSPRDAADLQIVRNSSRRRIARS